MARRLLLAVVLAVGACTLSPPEGGLGPADAIEAGRQRPPLLRMVLTGMPKGADLHSHLSGAVWAESYIAWAATDGLCVDTVGLRFVKPPCEAGDPARVPARQAATDATLGGKLVRAMSSGLYLSDGSIAHDQFFDAFSRFKLVSDDRGASMLAEVLGNAAAQNVLHVELMNTFNGGWASARKPGEWNDDFDVMATRLPGLPEAVAAARAGIDTVEAGARRILGCDGPQPAAGCAVTWRWLQQVSRNKPREQAFAAMLLGYALAEADSRVAGLNLVAPEDAPVSLADYALHMRMLAHLGRKYPKARLALHAGELVQGLVPPQDLRSHIRQAVTVAGAQRIGHGVDIAYEDDAVGLLQEMAARRVLVEINLTSNDLILGVRGKAHPLALYRAFGVPMALSTDDEGVSRIDLTREYQRAVEEQGLGYGDLRAMSRNALEYSFLPGASLWADPRSFAAVAPCAEPAAEACAAWAAASPRAARQRELELAFRRFEARRWPALN